MPSFRKNSIWTAPGEIALACARGLVPYALMELKAMGIEPTSHDRDSVTLPGTVLDALKLNLHLRTAHRVLFLLAKFRARYAEELYAKAIRIPWEDWIPADGYFTVHGSIRTRAMRDTRIPSLKLKDAIVDRIRDRRGTRPDSGHETKGASVFILWHEDDLRIFVDLSGEPLSKRGYRLIPGPAPMQETLAAGCAMASGWDPATPFIAPMCGSGTPAIEAALIAKRRAPGLTRKYYSFFSLNGFHDRIESIDKSPYEVWQCLRDEAVANEIPSTKMPRIVATDISHEAIRIARANAKAANVEQMISFAVCDFADTPIADIQNGTVFMNPEYGERMGEKEELAPVYKRIGDWFANRPDLIRCVFTASPFLAKAMCFEPNEQVPFFNGPLPCRLLKFNKQ